jgi:catechol 2,3-dioxygenase-like lactoylglutathione lyase family enzyme
MGIQTTGISHINLRVSDIDRSIAFYRDVLGFDVHRPTDDLAVFSTGPTLIGIRPPLEGTPEGDRFSEYRIGVDHLAFTVPDLGELEKLVEALRAAGVDTAGIETDEMSQKEYVAFRDPDNVQWECFLPLQ